MERGKSGLGLRKFRDNNGRASRRPLPFECHYSPEINFEAMSRVERISTGTEKPLVYMKGRGGKRTCLAVLLNVSIFRTKEEASALSNTISS